MQECAAIASAVASAVQQRGLGKRKLALVADIPEAVRNDLELLCRQKLESVNCDVGHDKMSRQRATFAIRDAAVASLRSAYPGTNCIKIGLPGKLILSKRKGLMEVLFS